MSVSIQGSFKVEQSGSSYSESIYSLFIRNQDLRNISGKDKNSKKKMNGDLL